MPGGKTVTVSTSAPRNTRAAKKKAKRDAKKQQFQKNVVARGPRGGQRAKKKQQAADLLLKYAGAHGKNTLAPEYQENKPESLAAQTQDGAMDVVPGLSKAALMYLAVGIMAKAKKKSWNASNDAALGYQAFRYLVDVLVAATQGVTPKITSAPRWFWEIIAALLPKEHTYVTGKSYYEAFLHDTSQPGETSILTMGTGNEQYDIVFGLPNGAPLNGFPTISPAAAYDPVIGEHEFSSIWSSFNAEVGKPSEMIANPGTSAFNAKDVSAFSMVEAAIGSSFQAPGGYNAKLENECHIDCPILAKFCYANHAQNDRFNNRAGLSFIRSGGSSCYIGPRCTEFTSVDQFRNKGRALFKVYDFWEFVEVFAIIIAMVMEKVNSQDVVAPDTYPLTIQQFAILLRQAMLPLFGNEMAQDLRYSEGGTIPLLPFVVMDNGVSITAGISAPMFPKFFAESVKGCSRRTTDISPDGSGRLTMDWIPILSGTKDRPVEAYTYDVQGNPQSVFVPTPGLEVPMSLVDCSLPDGLTTAYCDLNGIQYSMLVDAHNKWITTMQPFLLPATKLSQAKGSDLLASVCMTKVVRNVPADTIVTIQMPAQQSTKNGEIKSSSTKSSEPKSTSTPVILKVAPGGSPITASLVKQKPIGKGYALVPKAVTIAPASDSTYYQFLECKAVVSNLPFYSELVKFQSSLIAPWYYNSDPQESVTYIQSVYGEPMKLSFGDAVDDNSIVVQSTYPTLWEQHRRLAELDLKNISSSSVTDAELFLNLLDEHGEGGFLSTLAKILSTGSTIANKVASLTGM